MLTDHHIAIIKSTIPLLENAGTALTAHFYQRMFLHNPELKHIFNMANQKTGRQQTALFEAIAAYAKNIENLAALSSAVERIAHKHTSFNIQAEHYAIVGHNLLETLRELAPDAFTPEVEEAWAAAYRFLAQIFIDREAQLYAQCAATKGGWTGCRDFVVSDKIVESALVTSFVFTPIDQQAVIAYTPGQYLGVELTPKGSDYVEIRQYSLSDRPNGQSYRISVKQESGGVAGLMSNHLHNNIHIGDTVALHAPAGDFVFVDRQRPVVLVSAGVGITPMQAMLEQLAHNQYVQPVYFLHACENATQHTFAHRTQQLIEANQWQQHTWYKTEPAPSSSAQTGAMDLSAVALPISEGDFYLCGPVGFMQFAKAQLLTLGVPDNHIHYEVFGPHAAL